MHDQLFVSPPQVIIENVYQIVMKQDFLAVMKEHNLSEATAPSIIGAVASFGRNISGVTYK